MSRAAITVSSASTSGAPLEASFEQLWLATRPTESAWRTLALVPAGPLVAPEEIVHIALNMAHTGMVHTGLPVHVADATRVSLGQLRQFTDALRNHLQPEQRMILALSSLRDNVTSLPLALEADRALLCVVPGMAIDDAKHTVARIGSRHFVGSAVFHLPPQRSSSSHELARAHAHR